jgi:hypothetical protein
MIEEGRCGDVLRDVVKRADVRHRQESLEPRHGGGKRGHISALISGAIFGTDKR